MILIIILHNVRTISSRLNHFLHLVILLKLLFAIIVVLSFQTVIHYKILKQVPYLVKSKVSLAVTHNLLFLFPLMMCLITIFQILRVLLFVSQFLTFLLMIFQLLESICLLHLQISLLSNDRLLLTLFLYFFLLITRNVLIHL